MMEMEYFNHETGTSDILSAAFSLATDGVGGDAYLLMLGESSTSNATASSASINAPMQEIVKVKVENQIQEGEEEKEGLVKQNNNVQMEENGGDVDKGGHHDVDEGGHDVDEGDVETDDSDDEESLEGEEEEDSELIHEEDGRFDSIIRLKQRFDDQDDEFAELREELSTVQDKVEMMERGMLEEEKTRKLLENRIQKTEKDKQNLETKFDQAKQDLKSSTEAEIQQKVFQCFGLAFQTIMDSLSSASGRGEQMNIRTNFDASSGPATANLIPIPPEIPSTSNSTSEALKSTKSEASIRKKAVPGKKSGAGTKGKRSQVEAIEKANDQVSMIPVVPMTSAAQFKLKASAPKTKKTTSKQKTNQSSISTRSTRKSPRKHSSSSPTGEKASNANAASKRKQDSNLTNKKRNNKRGAGVMEASSDALEKKEEDATIAARPTGRQSKRQKTSDEQEKKNVTGNSKSLPKSSKNKSKEIECGVGGCGKTFSKNTLLNQHKWIVHGIQKEGMSMFQGNCTQCDKQFRHKGNLGKHQANCQGR